MTWLWAIYAVLGLGLIGFLILFIKRIRAHLAQETGLSLADYVAIVGAAFNVVLLVVAVTALHVAITTYQDAKQSGEEQTQSLRASREALAGVEQTLHKQGETLEKSRQALDSSVTTAIAQQNLLAHSVSNSKKQLAILQAQWARELEQADVHATLYYPQQPSIMLSNSSKVKPVRDGSYELITFNIDRPYADKFQLVETVSTPTGTIPPSYSYLPSQLNLILQPNEPISKGNRLFGYLSLSCAECAAPRAYWVLIKYGEEGWYKEMKPGESGYPFRQFSPINVESYVTDFLKQKDLVKMPVSLD